MGIDSSYFKDPLFFNSFATRFREKADAPAYAKQLDEKIRLLQYAREGRQPGPPEAAFITVCILLGCSLALNIFLALRKLPVAHVAEVVEAPALARNEAENKKGLIEHTDH